MKLKSIFYLSLLLTKTIENDSLLILKVENKLFKEFLENSLIEGDLEHGIHGYLDVLPFSCVSS